MPQSTTIKAIDSTSVHRITSGQVVIDLQTAVKELVENSLDSGATTIDVRFKDYGLKSIEVSDNGHGVAPEDYDSMALKHHTSKLASFEDLGTVRTFGFRGEALSSLCALSSSVSVATATADQAPMGTVIDFDRSGRVRDRNGKVARQRGTSVIISGLFTPLPVRRKEFEKNAKREFGKALNLLQAYALVPCAKENRGVRLTVSHHPSKGARSTQIRTDGSPSSRTSVSSLWGPRSLDNVVALALDFEIEPERSSVLKKRGIVQEGTTHAKVRGMISRFAPGCGRTSTDRQFFYVNGRPCNLSKLQKTFNEVYRSFNANQAPFVVADFQLPTRQCDINVSPDKRTIFIHSENNLIQALKTSLEEAFSPSRSTFTVNRTSSKDKYPANYRRPRPDRKRSLASDNETSREENNSDDDVSEVEGHDAPAENHSELMQSGKSTQHEEMTAVEKSPGSGGPMRWRSGPQSSSADLDRNIEVEPVVEAGPQPRDEDVEMATDTEDVLFVGVPTPDLSFSTEIEETHSPREDDIDSLTEAGGGLQPCAPLFLPSPRSALSSLPSGSQPPAEERAPSPVLPSSDVNALEMPPRKRQRTSSPAPTPSTVKSGAAQMVLNTSTASWNLKVQAARGDEDLATQRKQSKIGASARVKLRSQLSGYLAPGSQMKPIEVDEAVVSGDERVEDSTENEAFEQNGDEEQFTDRRSEVVEVVDNEAFQGSRSSSRTSNLVDVDLADNFVDEAEVGSGMDHDESTEGYMSRFEIVRTTTTTMTLRLDIESLSSTWSRHRYGTHLERSPASAPESCIHLQPSANVTNAEDAAAAERELARVIHKEDFASMLIVGQFNLGFIITRRITSGNGKSSTDDLFIVDQHAADEKYNFETLQQSTKIESQTLFRPRPLELTAADELLAIENVEVLRANGFEVLIDEDAHPGQGHRVKLAAQPVSKGTTFDMTDLEELLHLMRDNPAGHMVRCTKARAMFAMRACRKSVMVGKALTMGQMASVVRHMGTMDQPWNCPHGRPTMRHLASLNQINRGIAHTRDVDWTKFAHEA